MTTLPTAGSPNITAMRARAASLLVVAPLVAVSLTACNDDGRTLREPRPDQVGSVSTTAAPTTSPPAAGSEPAFESLPAPTIAPVPTPAPVGALQAPWPDGGVVPARHTCTDLDIAPALSWPPAPTGTVEIAVTLSDETAPGVVHWVMSGIDPFATSLAEGIVPEFATVGTNFTGAVGYAGPCPPAGETHAYRLTVHFLDQATELPDGAPGTDLQVFVNGATFGSLSVVGTYSQI